MGSNLAVSVNASCTAAHGSLACRLLVVGSLVVVGSTVVEGTPSWLAGVGLDTAVDIAWEVVVGTLAVGKRPVAGMQAVGVPVVGTAVGTLKGLELEADPLNCQNRGLDQGREVARRTPVAAVVLVEVVAAGVGSGPLVPAAFCKWLPSMHACPAPCHT